MLCDELSKLPIFETCVSGHVSDKTSFRNVITDYWDSIKAQFKDLRYLTGDRVRIPNLIQLFSTKTAFHYLNFKLHSSI